MASHDRLRGAGVMPHWKIDNHISSTTNPHAVTIAQTYTADTWHSVGADGEPAFANSWVNYDASHPAKFFKDALGFVHLIGWIKSGTVGSAAFTLPLGYRPPQDAIFPVDSYAAYGRVRIYTDGTVVPVTPSGNTLVCLDLPAFPAA